MREYIMQRNSGKRLKNNLGVNQNQLHIIIQIIIVLLKHKQLLPAYFLLIFDKIQVVWMLQSTTTAAKLPFEHLFIFFCIHYFFIY